MNSDTLPFLVQSQARFGDKTFVAIDGSRLSYTDAASRSLRVASSLIDAGVGRGARVALLMGNSIDFAVAFLAITRIGAMALPFSTMSTAFEIGGLLRNSDAEFLVSAPSYRNRNLREVVTEAIGALPNNELRNPAMPVLRRVWFGITDLEASGSPEDPRVAVAGSQVTPADPFLVIHTSGSTSAPKGVLHTHGQVIRNMRRQNVIRRYTADEALFANSPWFWIGGLAYSFLATFIAGAKLVCSSALPSEMLDLLEAERPTMTNGVATTMLALANDPSFARRDLSSMRRGNLYPVMPLEVRPADPELRYNLLGMTEAGSVCLCGDHEDDLHEAKRGSFGKPVEGIAARIVDPETGEDGNSGELLLRGANVMQGYLARERWECFDEEGWYHTGDMVSIDADGDFYFRGRAGDIIRTAGAQVSPREVESLISDLTGGRTSIVIGLPDAERGQTVAAVVVGSKPFDADATRAALRERLSPYKVPRRFIVMAESELPVMSSGKIDLRKLVEIVSAL